MTTDFIEEIQSLDNATRWRHAIFFSFFLYYFHPSNLQCREEEYPAGVSRICPKKIFSVYEYADKNRRDYSGAAAKIVCRPDCETREKSVYVFCNEFARRAWYARRGHYVRPARSARLSSKDQADRGNGLGERRNGRKPVEAHDRIFTSPTSYYSGE